MGIAWTILKLYFGLGCFVTLAIGLSEALAARKTRTDSEPAPDKNKGSFLGMAVAWLVLVLLWPLSLSLWIKASLRKMTLFDLFSEWRKQSRTARFRWVDATSAVPSAQYMAVLVQRAGRTHVVTKMKGATEFLALRMFPDEDGFGESIPLAAFHDLDEAKRACENDTIWIRWLKPEATEERKMLLKKWESER